MTKLKRVRRMRLADLGLPPVTRNNLLDEWTRGGGTLYPRERRQVFRDLEQKLRVSDIMGMIKWNKGVWLREKEFPYRMLRDDSATRAFKKKLRQLGLTEKDWPFLAPNSVLEQRFLRTQSAKEGGRVIAKLREVLKIDEDFAKNIFAYAKQNGWKLKLD